jgi:hypothetical protein
MTATLATRCRTASCDSFDLHAKEEFRQLATEFTTKANELEDSSKRCVQASRWCPERGRSFWARTS